ncbi:hypothetical protein Q1695_009633 [Nippostrongylus brasiliensis]|nr:hypothetical protein Q1695_009633 [Nippostrongylus brasiliensis]
MATVGKKVDARFVKNRYQEFLVGKTKSKESTEPRPQAKPNAALPYPMIKLQKREEMRRKGIFVEADNTENDNTFMEQISKSRPCVCRMRTRSAT